ncbi:MAG: trypsin-like peptidase domain-containing protein [Planctomycetaceae bacterium]|nr:trypsin-like peptidase domain-containing protein [Planctomycetaceae bacterium]
MVTLHAALAALAIAGAGQSPTVLLDFYADWCGPCKAMSPTVDALVAKGYPVQRVNIDQDRPLAAKYGIRSIPCFVMLVNGREVDRVNDTTTFSRLERMCKLGVPPATAPPSPVMRAQDGPSAATPAVLPAGFQANQTIPIPPTPENASGAPAADSMGTTGNPYGVPPSPAANAAPGVTDAAIIAASVRLRVEDPTGRSCGSGTIIDSRGGEALVLTCGHIFRDSQGKGKIEVDLFGTNQQAVPGKLVSYDLTRDVGLVSIRPTAPVAIARLAPDGYRVSPGQPVVSVGCNNGADPTARRSQVTRLNRFQGPPNIEVAGQPVEGRSGGGLFSADGYVIGVCNAADPSDREGLFVAADAIRAQLDQEQLSFVYKSPSGNTAKPSDALSPAGTTPVMPAVGLAASGGAADMPPVQPTSGIAPSSSLASHEQAAMDEIRRSLREGAEVVVVVRPRGKSDAQSEVIILDHVSPEFLKRLAAERRSVGDNIPVSRESSTPRKKWLEWSAPGEPAAASATPTNTR